DFKAGRMSRRVFAKRAMAIGMTGPLITSIVMASPSMAAPADRAAPLRGRRQASGGTLVFGAWQTPDTMDPQKTGLAATGRLIANVFDLLIWKFPGDDTFYPGLAKSWEVSPDGLEYTFHLRDDVKFHNGEPFDAASVKYTFDRLADPKNQTLAPVPLGYDHVDVIDNYTAKVVFKTPYSPFLTLLARGYGFSYMLPPKYAAENPEGMGLMPPGTGPFIIKEYVHGSHAVLERNPEYNWAPSYFGRQGPALLERIEWRIIEESGTRASTLESGETQLIEEIVPAQYERFRANPDLQVILQDTVGCPRTVHLNCTKAPTDDKAVRQAMNYAVDKRVITDVIFKKMVEPAYGPLEKLTPGYNPEVEKYYSFDPAKAKQTLDAAGWTQDGDYRKKNGQELKALFIVTAKDNFDEAAQVIQSQFKDVGINLELTTEAQPTIFTTYNRGDQNLANIFWWGVDPESLYSLYHSSQIEKGFNWCHYTNPDVDKLLEQGYIEGDETKRMDLYKQAQILIMEDAPLIPVWGKRQLMAGKKSITGITFNLSIYPLYYNTSLGE
ncbi:MAG: peptide/nickel transport system substrate-binding protein, partial [Thermomicrobiales bacterium]|nr:peptide/nickel transport system substrate-binding protein [Thermomicrobiales bacterium]